MSLSAYHRAFVNYLGSGDRGELVQYLESPAQSDRLAVYLNTYAVGSVDALERLFPALMHLLGTAAFRQLGRGYVAEHPPRHRTLSVYGRHFADFVDANVRDEVGKSTYCTDLVRLDSGWSRVYFASGSDGVGIEDLGNLEDRLEEQLFTLSDTAVRVETQWQVLSFWAKLRELAPDQSGEAQLDVDSEVEDSELEVEVEKGAESILLFREGSQIRYQPLSEAENAFVAALEEGHTLIEAGQLASDADLHGTYDLATSIAHFFTNRLLKLRD